MRRSRQFLWAGLPLAVFQLLQLPFVWSDQRYNGPEGVYWQVLRQLEAGRSLYFEIYYPQFPFFIELARLGRFLPGTDLAGARLLFSFFAPLAAAGLFMVARRWLTQARALAAAGLLLVSALFFALSHQLSGEVPALALALCGLHTLLKSEEAARGRYLWLCGSAVLFFQAIQIKPVTFLILFFAYAWRAVLDRKQIPNLFVHLAVCAGLTGAVLELYGWHRGGGAAMLQGGLLQEFLTTRSFPVLENIGSVLTTRDYSRSWVWVEIPCLIAALILIWRQGDRERMAVLASAAFTLTAALFVYIVINPDQLVLFVPLTAVAIASVSSQRLFQILMAVFAAGSVFFTVAEYSGSLPRANKSTRRAIRALQDEVRTPGYVLSNVPYIVAAAGRLTPPEYTDMSPARIASGSVTCAAIEKRMGEADVVAFVYRAKGLENLGCGEAPLRTLITRHFPRVVYEDSRLTVFARN